MENISIKTSTDLLEKVLKRVHREERIYAIKRITIFSITLTTSIIAFIPSLNILLADFSETGFINFFNLLFSDFSVVLTYWKSFTLVLLETLPALSLALFLAVIVTFLQSIKSLTKNIKIVRSTNLVIN